MNKTIIININGIVFHIEEDAYEILKSYMTEVQRHFMHSADSLEITTDIENRIAEMFNEILLRESKQVLIELDVQHVVEQMGSVADFESADEEAARPHSQQAFTYNTEARRLFRDPDDHLVGGVASGIANYFDIQSVWVRIAFVLLCGAGGAGFILYAILWIIVPKAVTRADRMAMKGEKLNLQGFKNNFEEEMSTVRNHLSSLHNEARPLIYKTRDFAGDFFHHLGNFLGGTGKILIKIIGIAFMLAAFIAMVALAAALIGYAAFGQAGHFRFGPFNLSDYQYNKLFLVSIFLLMAIPLLAIILFVLSFIFNKNAVNRSVESTLLIVWLCSVGLVIYYTAKVATNFKQGASFSQTINIKPQADSTYYLKLNDVKYLSKQDSIRLSIKDSFKGLVILDNDEEENMDSQGNVDIYIEKSDVPQPVLVESFSARGKDYEDALLNARSSTYQFQQAGNILKFNRRLVIPNDMLWRAQTLRLTLKVPLNSKMVIDEDLNRYVHDLSVYDCKKINKHEEAASAKFVMTNVGTQCKIDTLVTPKSTKPVVIPDSTKTREE